MKRTFTVVALAIGLGLAPNSHALTKVPRDYPDQSSEKPANSQDLPATVAVYQNDIVLVATNPDTHEIQSKKLAVDPAVLKAIREKAGIPLKLEALIAALQSFIRENPNAAIPATVAAFLLAQNAGLEGSPESSLVIAAIQALDGRTASYADDVATLIGFAVESSPVENQPEVLRQLRSLAIAQNATGRIDFTVSLDQALAEYNIIEAKSGGEEVLLALNDFLPDQEQGDSTEEELNMKLEMNMAEAGIFDSDGGATLPPPFGQSGVAKTFDGGGSPISGNPASQTNISGPNAEPTPTPAPPAS